MNATEHPELCVKELADALGRRSAGYVYKMRMAGFRMEWDRASHCYVATLARAQAWIAATGFTVREGWPVVHGEKREG